MGKVTCAACNKSCKSQAVRLDNKHYHLACFKCSLCEKSLASEGFFAKDNNRYCVDDYRRLFGTHCDYCGEYVEGEVVTALNHTYHEHCFCCSLCKRRFEPGDRVTLTGAGGKHCLCVDCDVDNEDDTRDGPGVQASVVRPEENGPVCYTTKETSEEIITPLIRETLSAPVTPARQLYNIDDNDEETAGYIKVLDKNAKRSMTNDRTKQYIMSTPSSAGYKSDMSRSIDFLNGSYADVRTSKESIHNIMRYRSISPGVSPRTGCRSVSPGAVSQKSRESAGSSYSSKNFDFSKFYQSSSYLDIMEGRKEFKRGPSLNPVQKVSLHYHRPAGSFSYTTARKDIQILASGGNKQSVQLKKSFWQYDVASKVDRQYLTALNKLSSSYQPDDTTEPIQLSKIPQAKTDEHRVAPIERSDWPAPPAPAAAYPELLREHGEKSLQCDGSEVEDVEDKENCSNVAVSEIDRKITELTKLTDSGAAQVILGDLKRLKMEGVALDPRSASRTPNAAVEPFFKTRYDSPVYASPSRDLDLHDRSQSSLDHLYIERKYRTTPVPMANSSVIDSEITSEKRIVRSNRQVPRPGYSLGPPRPASTIGDYRQRSGAVDIITSLWRPRSVVDISSDLNVFVADGDCCPVTGLKHRVGGSVYTNLGSNGYLGSQKSSLNLTHVVAGDVEETQRVYPLEELKKEVLPQGVNKEFVERHLASDDFVRVFGMNSEEFYRLPVWNRNELKIRVGLNRQ